VSRGLSVAFAANSFLTFMAFILLVAVPDALPNSVGVQSGPGSYFMGYLSGAAQWGLAAMTFFGRSLTDRAALRVIALSCIVFHVCSAAVLISTFGTGGSDFALGLWANVAVRLTISGLCAYFGLYKLSAREPSV
jgi:hypothetical protein